MADETEFHGASAASAHSCRDKAFEIFVKRTITSIQKEAWGRSKEVKEIREACQVGEAACHEQSKLATWVLFCGGNVLV